MLHRILTITAVALSERVLLEGAFPATVRGGAAATEGGQQKHAHKQASSKGEKVLEGESDVTRRRQ